MPDKIISGGLLFTVVSLFTYQFMFSGPGPNNSDSVNIKRKNASHRSNPDHLPLVDQKTLYKEGDDSPIVSLDEEVILLKKEKRPESGSNSFSSFFELRNTGSLTDTEELEFVKLNDYKFIDNILESLIENISDVSQSLSDSEIDNNNKSYYSVISYHSDSELVKNKPRIKNKPRLIK